MQSITQKMLLALIGSTIVVLMFVSGVSYFAQKSTEQDYWQDKRQVINSQLSVIFLEPVFAYDKPLIKATLEAVLKDAAITRISVLDQLLQQRCYQIDNKNIFQPFDNAYVTARVDTGRARVPAPIE